MEVSGPQSCGEHAFHLPHGDHAGHLLRPADIQPFAQGQGNIENHSNLRNCIFVPLLVENAIVDETGACNFSFHALRHAAASLFIKQTWPPKKIQTMLGHSSINNGPVSQTAVTIGGGGDGEDNNPRRQRVQTLPPTLEHDVDE